jgi:hypothetical protein
MISTGWNRISNSAISPVNYASIAADGSISALSPAGALVDYSGTPNTFSTITTTPVLRTLSMGLNRLDAVAAGTVGFKIYKRTSSTVIKQVVTSSYSIFDATVYNGEIYGMIVGNVYKCTSPV